MIEIVYFQRTFIQVLVTKVINLPFHPIDFPVAQYLGRSRKHVWLSWGSLTVKTEAFLREKDKQFYIIRGTKFSAQQQICVSKKQNVFSLSCSAEYYRSPWKPRKKKIFQPLRDANFQKAEKQYANFCKQLFFGQTFWNTIK